MSERPLSRVKQLEAMLRRFTQNRYTLLYAEDLVREARELLDHEGCPFCEGNSTHRGDPVDIFCDDHFRQYLATFNVAPSDLAAYREELRAKRDAA